ncbi:hypothetical protein RF55_23158, partial [Lasius niger]
MGKKEKRRRTSLDEDKKNRRLRRKIQRLEEKLDRQKEERQAAKNTLDNKSRRDDEAQATDVPAVKPPDNRAPEALPTELPSDAPQEVPEHEIELQQEIVDIIGACLESDKKTAAAIHKDVALRWSEIVKK